jgi:hypothetical protein
MLSVISGVLHPRRHIRLLVCRNCNQQKECYSPLFFTLLGFLCSYRGIYSIFPSNPFPFSNPSNIHLQCICSTKKLNGKKQHNIWQYGIKNYFYSDSLTRPRNVKISTLFWGTSGICVYSPRRCAPRWINHISPHCLKITYT